jgi:hypothetical protein
MLHDFFPVHIPDSNLVYDVVLADIVGDERLEILFCQFRHDKVYVIDAEGNTVWTQTLRYIAGLGAFPVTADINGDGRPEILCGDQEAFFVFDSLGNDVSPFPDTTFDSGLSIVINVDENPDMELVVMWPDCWRLRGINHDNQPAAGFPLQYGHGFMGSPAAYDIDEDGKLELMVATYDELFYVYDLESSEWDYPKFRFDPYNTGTYDRRQPVAPYISSIEKIGQDVRLTWGGVVADTFGAPEIMYGYVVYRSTQPDFAAGHSDSIGVVMVGDTVYRDVGALNGGQSYYYCVRAVDWARNQSVRSNIAYVFHKPFVENPGTTDKNWVSLPWSSGYSTVSDLTDDVSPSGDPVVKITNLRDDQLFESYLWDDLFMEWSGTNFAITSGRGYEMVSLSDTVLLFVGVNDPAGLVLLNENPAATDKNWVSVPYNAVYSTVKQITDEYCPSGDPVIKITNLRDDQLFESYLWDDLFMEWTGLNYAIEDGRGYEMVTVVDTTWDPTEYSSGSKRGPFGVCGSDIAIHNGTSVSSNRVPLWRMADGGWRIANGQWLNAGTREFNDANTRESGERDTPYAIRHMLPTASDADTRELVDAKGRESHTDLKPKAQSLMPKTSHILRGYVGFEGCEDLVFTVFCAGRPEDVLTESMVGCGWAEHEGMAVFWCDVGNFAQSWVSGEECVVIIEAVRDGCGQYAVLRCQLDGVVDIQELGEVALVAVPEPVRSAQGWSWFACADEAVIGYSLYAGAERLNSVVIERGEYVTAAADAVLRLVLPGGYETVYGSSGVQGYEDSELPVRFDFAVSPNPFRRTLGICYALPKPCDVAVTVYDATGRQVRSLVTGHQEPGYYDVMWSGVDDRARTVSTGVYFVQIHTSQYESQRKVILMR